jgi:hypothetical protein
MEDTPTSVLIEDLVEVSPDHLDIQRVTIFSKILDEMPPVTIFRTPQGLLLADGYHRVAAARSLGRTAVQAVVFDGSREDALDFATGKAAEGGISRTAAIRAIKRHSRGSG